MVTVRPLVATVLCAAVSVIGAQAQVASESQVKSAYLYHFAKMASWPQEALPTATSKLVMCVLGGDADFPDVLRSTLVGKNIGEHPIAIRHAQSLANAAARSVKQWRFEAGEKQTTEVLKVSFEPNGGTN